MENKDLDKPLTWIEKLLELARKYKCLEWIEAFAVLFILGVMITVFTNPGKIIELYQKASTETHIELLEYRQKNAAEVQHLSDRLLYKLNADRVVLLELHNNTTAISGLPFLKATATFEALNDGIRPIASQYQSTQLSLVPFASYLAEHIYYSGSSESIKTIDRSLAYKLMSNDVTNFAAGVITGGSKPIGFIFVTWCSGKTPPDEEMIQLELAKASMQTGVLLELKKEI